MAAQCATEVDNNPLWQFALEFYQQPSVAPLLLVLQNDHQQDTLLVLTALWLARHNQPWHLNQAQLSDYIQWRESVIWPLRAVRKAIPKHTERYQEHHLREHIQRDEIHAEQIGLAQLYELHPECKDNGTPPDLSQRALENVLQQARLNNSAGIKKEAFMPLVQHFIRSITA